MVDTKRITWKDFSNKLFFPDSFSCKNCFTITSHAMNNDPSVNTKWCTLLMGIDQALLSHLPIMFVPQFNELFSDLFELFFSFYVHPVTRRYSAFLQNLIHYKHSIILVMCYNTQYCRVSIKNSFTRNIYLISCDKFGREVGSFVTWYYYSLEDEACYELECFGLISVVWKLIGWNIRSASNNELTLPLLKRILFTCIEAQIFM